MSDICSLLWTMSVLNTTAQLHRLFPFPNILRYHVLFCFWKHVIWGKTGTQFCKMDWNFDKLLLRNVIINFLGKQYRFNIDQAIEQVLYGFLKTFNKFKILLLLAWRDVNFLSCRQQSIYNENFFQSVIKLFNIFLQAKKYLICLRIVWTNCTFSFYNLTYLLSSLL